MSKTTVVNVRDKVPGAIYVGRANPHYGLAASPFQNPYKIGPDGTREEVIAKYRAYLLGRPDLLAQLPELRGQALACWCKSIDPKKPQLPCHADVLAEFADREQEGE